MLLCLQLHFLCFVFGKQQDSVHSPVEDDISHELFTGGPAVSKFKVEIL